MSSTDSPSEVQSAAAAEQEATRALVLPPEMAGCDATGPKSMATAAASEWLAALRRFHLSGSTTEPLTEGFMPASLFFAAPTDETSANTLLLLGTDAEATGMCGTLLLWPSLIQRLQQAAATANGSSLLQQHLDEFQKCVAKLLPQHAGIAPAQEVFEEAGRQWLQEHDGDAAEREALLQEIQRLCASWGTQAHILLPSDDAYLHLLLHVTEHVYQVRRSTLRKQIEDLAELLRAFLAVETSKDQDARSAQGLQRNMGQVGAAFLDTSQLAQSLGPYRGAAQLAPEQRLRAEEILESLYNALRAPDAAFAVVIHDGSLDTRTWNADKCESVVHDDPCRGAGDLFEVRARESANLFRDMHIAHLLLENRYEPQRHDPWFERFDWRGFTQDELSHLPTVVAVESSERLAAGHLPSLSALLSSGKPVQILASQSPWQNPASPDEEKGQARIELGYLGMGHRKALVQQGTLQQPEHLTDGYRQALESPHPALHVVAREETSHPERDWLMWEAATLSRAHPLFCYNPDAGTTWARRMEFNGNPQPQKDWSAMTVSIAEGADSHREWLVPSTFADFVLLGQKLHHHFMRVADEHRSEDLLRLDEYLQLSPDEARHRLPWIWACDPAGVLHRLVVSRNLVQLCRDRLDYWHTLQELAGVRNQYVEDAVQQTRQEERQAHEAQIQRLKSEHAAALTTLEHVTVQKSMRRLSRMLLDLDPMSSTTEVAPATSPTSDGGATAPADAASPTDEVVTASDHEIATPASEAAAPEVAAPAKPAQHDEDEEEEPWIESALCTSCNDCLAINGQLFVYNENKQALIGDPHSGTFEQLVIAAEKCPAHCIHPGTPLNKQEANLESLIKRAAPFN